MAGHQRTADTPAGGGRANGRTPRRVADRGGAILRMGINACAMGMGAIRREPQRGGREDLPALYPGVRMLTGNYLSSTPRELRVGGAELE
jgi:hypothetical protein